MTTSKGTLSQGRKWLGAAVAAGGVFGDGAAWGGQPAPWEINLQAAASPVMEFITTFHNWLVVVITLITLFVLALLIVVVVKFNAKSNPVPSKTTHNVLLEVAWTVLPIVILVLIAIPSFKLLREQLVLPNIDLTIKATGKQWFWTYNYPDNGAFEFDSLMVQEKDLKPGQPRLLAVDNEIVVPVNKNVRVQTIASDVIHAFAIPAFGIKIDAIPGRLNETWFRATKEGWYYGQCSELCGKDHAFMPIAIRVVSEQEFNAWVEASKKKFATAPGNAFASATSTAAQ